MASYNDFTVQELERAAKRVLSQNKRYTYSSNKLQPSERMRGSKVTGGRRKTNRPSTPSLKTSQQIYKNRQPGQQQSSSSNSHRRYGRYNTNNNNNNNNNSSSKISNKIKLKNDLPRRRRRSKSGGGKDENHGSSRRRYRSNSSGSSSGDEGGRSKRRAGLSYNRRQVLNNSQGGRGGGGSGKKRISKKPLNSSSSNNKKNNYGAENTKNNKSGLAIVESAEGEGSTIAGFIKRFRDGEPSSPEVRSQQRRNNKNSFWWKSNNGEGGGIGENGISPSPARGSGKEAVARLREKSQLNDMSSDSTNIKMSSEDERTMMNNDNNKKNNTSNSQSNNNNTKKKKKKEKKNNEMIASNDLESRTKSILDHCNTVLNVSDTNADLIQGKKKTISNETKTNYALNEKGNNLDDRTKKVLEDCNEILSMNRIETKRVTVEEGLGEKLTVGILNDGDDDAKKEVEDVLDADNILERARQALNKATENIFESNNIDINKDENMINDDSKDEISEKLTPSIKSIYNENNDLNIDAKEVEQNFENISISRSSYNGDEQDLKRLDEALRETVRRGLFTF